MPFYNISHFVSMDFSMYVNQSNSKPVEQGQGVR